MTLEAAWIEVVKASPYGAIIIAVIYLLLKAQREERLERALNAKERADAERTHDMEKNKLWSETIKSILDRQTESSQNIISAIQTMQKDIQEKYESMGITKDLLDAARQGLARRKE